MAKVTPKKFAMQQCFEILLRRPSDKKILAYLTDCKTSSLENTVEMVYPTGGAGNVYIGTGFGHSRRSTLTVESATFNTEVMAIQNGTEIATGSHELTAYDVLEVGADATENGVKTKHTAIGTANAEIGYVYLLNEDGTYGKTLEQAAAAASGKFKYESAQRPSPSSLAMWQLATKLLVLIPIRLVLPPRRLLCLLMQFLLPF